LTIAGPSRFGWPPKRSIDIRSRLDSGIAGKLESKMSNEPIDPDEIRDPMSPREQIMTNVAVIKQAIKLDWARMAEDALTPEERDELRAQIKEWTDDLATLGARLDQIGE
jgi:hypothetical protein